MMTLNFFCTVILFTMVGSLSYTNKFRSMPRRICSLARLTPTDFSKYSFVLALFSNEVSTTERSGKIYPKLDFNEDYYSVLEVSPTIPASDLKKAYYKMVFKYHPDNKVGEEVKALCNKQVIFLLIANQYIQENIFKYVYM